MLKHEVLTWVSAVDYSAGLAMSKVLCLHQLHARIYIHGNGVRLSHVIQGECDKKMIKSRVIKKWIKFTVTEVVNMCSVK